MSGLISIIVPIYNVDRYLEECLDSIIRQTYHNFEVILVDDGSTDRSGDICDRYCSKDKRFRVIHKINGGVSSARNAGVDMAKGDYIGFVDPDDWIDDHMYEVLYQDMIKSNADMVMCAYYEIGISDPEKDPVKKVIPGGLVPADTALENMLDYLRSYLWCRLYKRKVFEGQRFKEGHNYEDIEIMPRLILNCQTVYYGEEALYYYRMKREGSIIATNTPKNLDDYFWSNIAVWQTIKRARPKLAGKGAKGAAVSYLAQYKRLTVMDRVTKEQMKELKQYRTAFYSELAGNRRETNMSVREKGELIFSRVTPRGFIWFCKVYRRIIGRELG